MNAQQAVPKKKFQQDADILAAAFDAFNRTTLKLQQTYMGLEDQVTKISDELEKKNIELERKIVEVENMKQYANDIIDSITSGLIVVDIKERATTFNRRAREITGLSNDKVIGKKLPEELAAFKKPLADTRATEKNTYGEFTLKNTEEDIPISIRTSPLYNGAHKKEGAIAIFSDLSEIKELQEKLNRSERLSALGEMAARVAHEIRNPLGGIEGFASLLYRDLRKEPQKQKLAKNIIIGAQSLNRIVSDLLMFTKPLKFKFSQVDLNQVLDEVVLFVKTSYQDKEICVEKELPKRYIIDGDAYHLKQLFLNLVINAVESTDGMVNIRLTGRELAGRVLITVSDNGCGIKNTDLKKLFYPFFTTKEKGTGLGLAIAYRIVEEHSANIKVDSSLGKGTSFTVSFKKSQNKHGEIDE